MEMSEKIILLMVVILFHVLVVIDSFIEERVEKLIKTINYHTSLLEEIYQCVSTRDYNK